MDKKLYRDDLHKNIGGVCAGLAEYFGIDVSLVRLAFLLTLILKGGGLLIYIILWIVLPKKPYAIPNFNQNINVDYTVPPMADPNQPIPPVFTERVKKHSTASVIGGAILIIIGGCFLLDEFDIIPDVDFEHFWPLILIGIGLVVLFTGKDKKPWEDANWNKKETVKDFNTEQPTNDNNTTTL